MRRNSPVEEVWFPLRWFMKGSHRTGWFGLFAFICLALVTRPAAVSPNVVISQVYGGGGNSGAPFTHDFIELFNRGSAPRVAERVVAPVRECDRDWQLRRDQRAAHDATRRRPPARSVTWSSRRPMPPVGAALPAPDLIDLDPINMSGTAGKVALVIGNTSLGCNGGSSALPPRPLHATAARRCIHAPCRSQLAM